MVCISASQLMHVYIATANFYVTRVIFMTRATRNISKFVLLRTQLYVVLSHDKKIHVLQ